VNICVCHIEVAKCFHCYLGHKKGSWPVETCMSCPVGSLSEQVKKVWPTQVHLEDGWYVLEV